MSAIYKWDFPVVKRETRERVMKAVCIEFDISEEELRSKRAFRHLVDARTVYAWLCREYLSDTYMRIGKELGGRTHSAVISLVNRMEDFIYVKDNLTHRLKLIEHKILTQSI